MTRSSSKPCAVLATNSRSDRNVRQLLLCYSSNCRKFAEEGLGFFSVTGSFHWGQGIDDFPAVVCFV
jgi:hypothetical protein